jgi:DNA ligase 4
MIWREADIVTEFWRIRSLVEQTGRGPRAWRHNGRPSVSESQNVETQNSLVSNASDGGTRHLALVFFDILLLDGCSLLQAPYSRRRSILESVITPIPQYSMLAERKLIDDRSTDRLKDVFAETVAQCEEGLVLKAEDTAYNDWRRPWVKLKKDYIPGLGDTLDLILVGAGWDKDRARELRGKME